MTTSALIDLIINFGDNSDAADADNATRRLRILQYAQEVFEDIWSYQQWPWKITSATVTVTAGNNSANLPSDFDIIGDQCGVFDSAGNRYTQVSPAQLIERRINAAVGYSNRIYAIFGFDTTSNIKKFQTLTMGVSTPFTVYYLKDNPTLVDSTINSKLEEIPSPYHQTVVLPGVLAKAKMSIGDGRDYKSDYKAGLAAMWQSERPRRDAVRRLPLSRRMW